MKIKHLLHILTLVLFSSFAQASSLSISPQSVLQRIENKQAPLILDVRSAPEFAQGHIPGAINIDYQLLSESRLLDDYKDQEIVIYCRSGRRADIAAKILQNKGFQRLVDLHGHMNKWQELQYPLAYF